LNKKNRLFTELRYRYLLSKDELNRLNVKITDRSGFLSANYRSSTEYFDTGSTGSDDGTGAMYQNFSTGTQGHIGKLSYCGVCAVRSFKQVTIVNGHSKGKCGISNHGAGFIGGLFFY
jgi:hypothetical protein